MDECNRMAKAYGIFDEIISRPKMKQPYRKAISMTNVLKRALLRTVTTCGVSELKGLHYTIVTDRLNNLYPDVWHPARQRGVDSALRAPVSEMRSIVFRYLHGRIRSNTRRVIVYRQGRAYVRFEKY